MNRLEWHGEEAKREVQSKVVKGLYRAAQVVSRRAKELINVEGAGQGKKGRRDKKGRFKSSLVYGANPSKPGEPPHKQTGHLLRSVAYEVDEEALEARVGTNVPYGKFLELGTKAGLAPRPWLRRALHEVAARLGGIFRSGG
jgi:phage gpG-like protein